MNWGPLLRPAQIPDQTEMTSRFSFCLLNKVSSLNEPPGVVSFVDLSPLVLGSWVQNPLKPPRWDLGQVIHSQLPVALRREAPTVFVLCWDLGAPLSSSGLEEAL